MTRIWFWLVVLGLLAAIGTGALTETLEAIFWATGATVYRPLSFPDATPCAVRSITVSRPRTAAARVSPCRSRAALCASSWRLRTVEVVRICHKPQAANANAARVIKSLDTKGFQENHATPVAAGSNSGPLMCHLPFG